jgi:formylglycine-generating enzyme required for sulfatase activity
MLTTAAALLALLTATAQAVTIDLVTVGNPGNLPDARYATPGYGAVGYAYNIGKYEVTAGQYTDFLNAVAGVDTYALYNTSMSRTDFGGGITRTGVGTAGSPYIYTVATDSVSRPINYVSYWDACRFANWLHNGQPVGLQASATTEDGAYTLNGYNGQDGREIARNPGATWFLPSEDEWYKAAYHKNDGPTGNYWDYPTKTTLGSPPGRDMTEATNSGNNANVNVSWYGIVPIDGNGTHYTTVAGQFQLSDSAYHTFDQGGNVWEWNETIVHQGWMGGNYAKRGLRGGSYGNLENDLRASARNHGIPTDEGAGFRVASVPEPASFAMLAGIAATALLYYWRKHV